MTPVFQIRSVRSSHALWLALGLAGTPLAAQVPLPLPVGTRVLVSTIDSLSSRTAKSKSPLSLIVDADLVSEGHVIIAKGTPVRGTIVDADGAGRFGHAGKLEITVDSVTASDGQVIRLLVDLRDTTSATPGDSGTGGQASKLSGMIPGSDLIKGVFHKGEDISFPPHTPLPVFIAEHATIMVPGTPPAPPAASTPGDSAGQISLQRRTHFSCQCISGTERSRPTRHIWGRRPRFVILACRS